MKHYEIHSIIHEKKSTIIEHCIIFYVPVKTIFSLMLFCFTSITSLSPSTKRERKKFHKSGKILSTAAERRAPSPVLHMGSPDSPISCWWICTTGDQYTGMLHRMPRKFFVMMDDISRVIMEQKNIYPLQV